MKQSVKLLLSVMLLLSLTLSGVIFAGCWDDEQQTSDHNDKKEETMKDIVFLTIGSTTLKATLAETEAARELKSRLPITVNLHDYGGWEKVGEFGFNLPESDEPITAEPCDFVLYQGNQLVIFYGSNSWNYTRLGKIQDVSATQLKQILGDGDVSVTVSLSVD